MADFTPINTQEEFDAAISDRLKQERETIAKNYSDYDTMKVRLENIEKDNGSLKAKIEENDKKIKGYEEEKISLTTKLQGYETNSVKMRIAQEVGLPIGLADRLSGDNEEAIRSDAEGMLKMVGGKTENMPPPPPLNDPEGGKSDGKEGYRNLLNGIKGDE
ncbi:MAG: hypothetical protein RSA49_05185 [Anaerovoracaceae bacterium]